MATVYVGSSWFTSIDSHLESLQVDLYDHLSYYCRQMDIMAFYDILDIHIIVMACSSNIPKVDVRVFSQRS